MKIRALVDYSENIPAWLKWRITKPYRQLRREGIDANIDWFELVLPQEQIDILVIPRLIVGQIERGLVHNWFRALKAQGITLVYEADDDIWSQSYIEHIMALTIKDDTDINMTLKLLDELNARVNSAKWILNQCDYITVSTLKLKEYVETLTDKKVFVIPNAIDVGMFERALDNRVIVNNTVTIGWAGGRRDIRELDIMIEAWKLLAKRNKNVIFVATSWLSVHLDKFEEFTDRVVYTKWEAYETYAHNLRVDIGCCAVDNSDFCSRKSVIKSWEYSLAGALVVGTSNLYGSELGSALTTNDVETYANIIEYYAKNESDRKMIAGIQKEHVLANHDLRYEYRNWSDVYNTIYELSKVSMGV